MGGHAPKLDLNQECWHSQDVAAETKCFGLTELVRLQLLHDPPRNHQEISRRVRHDEEGQEKSRRDLQAHPPDVGPVCFEPNGVVGFARAGHEAKPRADRSTSDRRG